MIENMQPTPTPPKAPDLSVMALRHVLTQCHQWEDDPSPWTNRIDLQMRVVAIGSQGRRLLGQALAGDLSLDGPVQPISLPLPKEPIITPDPTNDEAMELLVLKAPDDVSSPEFLSAFESSHATIVFCGAHAEDLSIAATIAQATRPACRTTLTVVAPSESLTTEQKAQLDRLKRHSSVLLTMPDSEAHYLLSLIMLPFVRQGIVCVDFEDMLPLFDVGTTARYAYTEVDTADNIRPHLSKVFPDGQVRLVCLAIAPNDRQLGLAIYKQVLAQLREFANNDVTVQASTYPREPKDSGPIRLLLLVAS